MCHTPPGCSVHQYFGLCPTLVTTLLHLYLLTINFLIQFLICQTRLSYNLVICHTWMRVYFHIFYSHNLYLYYYFWNYLMGHECVTCWVNSTWIYSMCTTFMVHVLHLVTGWVNISWAYSMGLTFRVHALQKKTIQ